MGSAYEDANAALKDYQANQVGADNAPVPQDAQDEANSALVPYMTPGGDSPAGPQGPQDNLKDLPQPVGMWESMGKGFQRQLGRMWSGVQQKAVESPVPYGVEDPGQMVHYQQDPGWNYDRLNAVRDLDEQEAQAQQEYAPYAKGHPIASTIGEMGAVAPLAALGPQRVIPQAGIAALTAGMEYHDPKSTSAGNMLTAFPEALAIGKLANTVGRVALKPTIQRELGARFDLAGKAPVDPVDRGTLIANLKDISDAAANAGVQKYGDVGQPAGRAFDNILDQSQPLTMEGLRTHASALSRGSRSAYKSGNRALGAVNRASADAMNNVVVDNMADPTNQRLFKEAMGSYGKWKTDDPLGSGLGLKEMVGMHLNPNVWIRAANWFNPTHLLPKEVREAVTPRVSPVPFEMTGSPLRKGFATGIQSLGTGLAANPQTLQVLGGAEDAATGIASGLRVQDLNMPQ